MNGAPKVLEHLRQLAADYRDAHLALQKRYRETTSAADFLAELKQREMALLNRYRQLQHQLLALLNEEQLEKMLDLSRIFDEIRVIHLFATQALTKIDRSPADQNQ